MRIPVCANRLGVKPDICHNGRVRRLLHDHCPNCRASVSDQDQQSRLVLLLTSGIEPSEMGVLGCGSHSEDRSIASINFDTLCSAAGNARASGHPSAAATRPYGTAALRGPTATDPDTPARRAADDRRPAAAPRFGLNTVTA